MLEVAVFELSLGLQGLLHLGRGFSHWIHSSVLELMLLPTSSVEYPDDIIYLRVASFFCAVQD